MGYYTTFNLNWKPKDEKVSEHLAAKQLIDPDFCHGIEPNGESADSVKWYDHELDIKTLSKEFPEISFVLTGHGEEAGDTWATGFKNGVIAKAETQYLFPDGTVVPVRER